MLDAETVGLKKKKINACILRYYMYLSKTLTGLSCSLNAVFLGLKMWDTFAFDCFDFKVRPKTLAKNPCLQRQSNLKSPQTTCNCIFLSNYKVQLHCLQRAPGCRVTEKSHFSTRNLGLDGTGNQTQATCLAGSVAIDAQPSTRPLAYTWVPRFQISWISQIFD
jgi:hypothetical protein